MSGGRPTTKIVIDWISFRLVLPTTSNYQFVHRFFEGAGHPHARVHSEGGSPSGAASSFWVKLQDPVYLRSLPDLILSQWPGSRAILLGMEVALDTYIADGDEHELAEVLVERFKWMAYPTDGRWHLYRESGGGSRALEGKEDITERDLIQMFEEQWQLTDHKKWKKVPVRFHLHVKITDRGGKVKLKREQWRARFEITLAGSALPWTDVQELRTAKFTVLQEWFRFRRLAAHTHPAIAYSWKWPSRPAAAQPGRSGRYRRPRYVSHVPRRGRPLKYRYVTEADTDLNSVIYDRLRDLRGARD